MNRYRGFHTGRLSENALPKMCVTNLWGSRSNFGSVAGYVTQIRIGFIRKVGACRLGELVFGQSAGRGDTGDQSPA